jgi:tetratricopeptide (TPR) repeat protein
MVRWSTDLLDEPTRRVFDRLGVFAGPFTASMAGAVVGLDGGEVTSREHLDELVTASLAVADISGETAWYRLLHPVRAVALDRLRQVGDLPETQSRLVDHVVELALGAIAESASGWDSSVLGDLLALYGNIIASLRWTLDHDDEPDRSLILLAVLWGVVHQAHTGDVARIGQAVLDRWPDPTVPGWADAASTVATSRNLLGDPAGAIELARAALAHAAPSPFAPATLRRVLAQAHRASGRLEAARDHFLEGAEVAAERDAVGVALELRVDHGLLVAELGDVDAGIAIIEQAHADAVAGGAGVNAAWALTAKGVALGRRDAAEALPHITAALTESRAIGYPAGVSGSLRALATARLDLGDVAGTAVILLELIDELLQRGGLNDLRMVLDIAALLLEPAANPRWADLAATAAAMPVTTVGTAVDHPVFERAAATGQVLSIRDAYVVCRRELRQIATEATPAPPTEAAELAGPDAGGGAGPARREESSRPALERDGDVWRFSYGGSSVTVKASKGVTDLASLLAEPGRELSALDLMGAVVAGSGGDEVLDTTARRRYEERIRDLQAGIDEADAANDLGRSERLQAELDILVDHLTAALGLGGRARRAGNEAERARSAVTQRIRSTIRRLAEHHPSLGAHLDTSIVTGTFCSYRPPSTTTWTVRR